jgi:hypothetical protein
MNVKKTPVKPKLISQYTINIFVVIIYIVCLIIFVISIVITLGAIAVGEEGYPLLLLFITIPISIISGIIETLSIIYLNKHLK